MAIPTAAESLAESMPGEDKKLNLRKVTGTVNKLANSVCAQINLVAPLLGGTYTHQALLEMLITELEKRV